MTDSRTLRSELAALAARPELIEAWPEQQLQLLARAGVLGWLIPAEFGGSPVSERDLLSGYVELAAACLTTTFVLTQRNGACQRIVASANRPLKERMLPALARGDFFATVGISHLTTSRQHFQRPTVRVTRGDGIFLFNGEVPWVTGASAAKYVVTGGTLEDGTQILAAIETSLPGVAIAPAAKLLALDGSATSSMQLTDVRIAEEDVIAGPIDQVMKQGGAGAGSLSTSALAVGHALSCIEHLEREAALRPELEPIIAPLRAECTQLRAEILLATDRQALAEIPAGNAELIRGRANSLALRSSQSLLAASKGAGFVVGHFAERAVREAMFFLVWSCPQPVVTAALREFAGLSTC